MVLVTVCSDRPFASPALTGLCISRDGAPFCRLAGVSPGLPLLGTREAPSTCRMRSRTCDEVPKLSGLGSSSDYSVGHASVPWQSSTRATLGMSWSRGLWSQFSSSPDSEHRGLCLSALALHVPLRATSFCRGLLGGVQALRSCCSCHTWQSRALPSRHRPAPPYWVWLCRPF